MIQKLLLVIPLALSLGACSTLQNLQSDFSLVTSSVANPITTTKLYQIESGIQIALTGLQTYKQACIAGAADKNCAANIASVQVYTRQIPPLLTQLRSFVKSNDQINAQVVYNNINTLITNFKAAATAVGINTGA